MWFLQQKNYQGIGRFQENYFCADECSQNYLKMQKKIDLLKEREEYETVFEKAGFDWS